jgi:oligopeptidase A
MPSYLPFMEHARKRNLRKKLWEAHSTRASTGETNNEPLITEILKLRKAQAELLGFTNWAERSLAEKMAENVPAVMALLAEVREPARARALTDLRELQSLAKQQGETEPLEVWDTAFWRARFQEQALQFNDEILRPYFPLPHVLKGLFSLIERLFAVTLESAHSTTEVWNSDVLFFHAKDSEGEHIASLYFDPYSRPENKRGGAWMNICTSRRIIKGDLEIPVAYICCNNRPPVGDAPSLLSFGEVTTLFHEMGHALQHMLTTVNVGQVSGISGVEWDAVELASQFMENWCYDEPTLRAISKHHITGEQLPTTHIEKLRRFRTFTSGLTMVRQIAFGEIDMTLHSTFIPESSESINSTFQTVAKRNLVVLPPENDRFLCAFSHIFSGGYAAGYYSYLWAEVLSSDAFAAFEEVGMENESEIRTVGKRYRDTVLALGGARHPLDVFREFRGRGPQTAALLRHRGLKMP